MNFAWTDEQCLLRDGLARILRSDVSPARRDESHDSVVWQRLTEAGLPGLPVAESLGGLGGDAAMVMAAMDAVGYELCGAPVLMSVMVCTPLLARYGGEDVITHILPAVLAGEVRLGLAFTGPDGGDGWDSARVRQSGGHQVLSGQKSFVLHGGAADHFLVGCVGEADEPACYLVPSTAAGVRRESYRIVDGSDAADLVFDNLVLEPRFRLACSADDMRTAVIRGMIAGSAEMVGIMRRLFEMTLGYVQTRHQFGVSIGSFQAIQHRMARLRVDQEQAYSSLLCAVLTPEHDAIAWRRAAFAAYAVISSSALRMGHESIQLHGGMGTTDELMVGHYHKRLMVLTMLFGSAACAYDTYEEAWIEGAQ